MSLSNMVADKQKETGRFVLQYLPMFDSTNVVTWSKKLTMWLIHKKRNHLGLEERPKWLPINAPAYVKVEYTVAMDS